MKILKILMSFITLKIAIINLILLTVLIVGCTHNQIQEEDPTLIDCGPWINCDPNTPNATGTCCRICNYINFNYKIWDCIEIQDSTNTRDEVQRTKKLPVYDALDPRFRRYNIL